MLMAVMMILLMQISVLGYLFAPQYVYSIGTITWWSLALTWGSYAAYEIVWRWRNKRCP